MKRNYVFNAVPPRTGVNRNAGTLAGTLEAAICNARFARKGSGIPHRPPQLRGVRVWSNFHLLFMRAGDPPDGARGIHVLIRGDFNRWVKATNAFLIQQKLRKITAPLDWLKEAQ